MPIEDPETGENLLLATNSSSVRSRYAESQGALSQRVAETVRKAGAALVDIRTDADPVQELRQFFHPRKRGSRR